MSVLLRRIRRTDAAAASVLERADFHTDSEIRSLAREDLCELFPGAEKLKLRRAIFGIIHKQKPINVLLKELQGFIPHEPLKAALSSDGILVDYLHILRDMKSQVNNVQSFLEAHINLLEDIGKAQAAQEPLRGVSTNASTSVPCAHSEPYNGKAEVHPDVTQVMYQMVVIGKTSDAHLQMMAKVQAQVQDRVQLISCSQDCQIVFVFCPGGSRDGTDVEAAMTSVMGDEPVILVLMHCTHEVEHAASMRKWSGHSNVVLQVNVFYQEMARGLLRCQENTAAVSQIQKKLLEYSFLTSKPPVTNRTGTIPVNDAENRSELSFSLFHRGSSSSSTSSSSSDTETKSIWGPAE
ncbi:uncharacterized protein LOC133464859 [Cololabis saira]|uniref:uncharacterized protein LOC133464859 n=1 Tax=Cololabis saira TaxID=129043 RepID=UPI002AD1F76C|nr:uncharacterized protein LOC133464859 [Cololabis saira]